MGVFTFFSGPFHKMDEIEAHNAEDRLDIIEH